MEGVFVGKGCQVFVSPQGRRGILAIEQMPVRRSGGLALRKAIRRSFGNTAAKRNS